MSAPTLTGATPRYALTLSVPGRTRFALGVAVSACELAVLLRAAFATQRSRGAILRLTSNAFAGACRWRFDGATWQRESVDVVAASATEGAAQ
jgi:hypothetical protein